MEKKNDREFARELLKAYDENIFDIIWTASGCTIAVDDQKRDKFSEIESEEFINYAFHIFRIVSSIAEGRKIEPADDEDIEIAEQIYKREYDVNNHIYVKRNSKINSFKYLEYDIISHKIVNPMHKQDISTAVIKLKIDKENKEDEVVFEVTKRDLTVFLSKLNEIKHILQN